MIPGPRQCKDITSFLISLLEELLELKQGIQQSGLSPKGEQYYFKLQAFIIHIFGDIPAIAKLLGMKGHNTFSPCHACYIEGFLYTLGCNSVYYVPLVHPDKAAEWTILPMHTHASFLNDLAMIEAEHPCRKACKELA